MASVTPNVTLASRLAQTAYSEEDCITSVNGTALPQNLGNDVVRLALVAGIRRHLHLACHAAVAELCAHDAEQIIFARARNARLIMTNKLPEEDMMRGTETQPYCIWHPDVAREQTYRALVSWYPEMKYQVARACAVGSYINLYRELDVLPDVSIAEEARETAPPDAKLNADTAVASTLSETRKYSQDFAPGWRPFDITEDWRISTKTISLSRHILTPDETDLLGSPLPFDVPTCHKNILILMAAYSGNLDRYIRLRRPTPIPGEWHCFLRGLYYSTFLATYLARPSNAHIIAAVGVQPQNIQALYRAIDARRFMNNDVPHLLVQHSDRSWIVPDEEL